MMLWLVFLLLTALALWLMLRPLFGANTPLVEARRSELAVYRDQLGELEADLERGIISANEVDAARLEIKRKMLAVAAPSATPHQPSRIAAPLRMALGIGLPVAAVVLYTAIGRPDLIGTQDRPTGLLLPEAPATQSAGAQLPAVETLVERLAQRLKTSPNDAKGWKMLGWSYAHLEKFDQAAQAYEKAVTLDPKNADLRSQYGESVVRAAGGTVTGKAETIFDGALALDPAEPRALFFRGLALDQHGKSRETLALWVKIIRDGDADAEWMSDLRKQATALALKLKLDPAKAIPGGAVEISPAGSGQIAAVDPATRAEQLSSEIERDPKNLENWISLARAHRAAGKVELGRASLARAKEIFAGAPFALTEIAAAEAEFGSPPANGARGPTRDQVPAADDLSPEQRTAMVNGMVAGLAERLRRNPNDLDGWLMLARSRAVMGDGNAARTAIGRAQELFKGDATARAKIAKVAMDLGLN
jgi:cytochrome c-type biogenesis protein CcmH